MEVVYQIATMVRMSSEFNPSTPAFHIFEFKFEFEFITSSWIRYATGDEFVGVNSREESSSTAVQGGGDDVLEAVREAIEARVPLENCDDLVDRVMEGACLSQLQHRPHGRRRFVVRIIVETINVTMSVYDGMVPAAESSIRMLDKCEAGATSFGDGDDGCCSVCLDEFVGGGATLLRMPCLHVFHGGCIKEWLRRSHYCPICRYQMPTGYIRRN